MSQRCAHTDMILLDRPTEADKDGAVCDECAKIGGEWLHLRMCMTCGKIGCCDDSPNRHARAHAETDDHPIITSAEPRERWRYCYVEDRLV